MLRAELDVPYVSEMVSPALFAGRLSPSAKRGIEDDIARWILCNS